MARTLTRGELRTRLEQLTDTENDAHISTTEKNAIINSAVAETWDKICNAGLGEKYVKSVTFNTVANQTEYVIATICPALDFYRLHQLYVVENASPLQMRPLQRLTGSEIQSFRPPPSVIPMKIYYIPYATVFAVGDDAVTFDGINGWEEHTLMTAACAIKMKKDDSYAVFAQRKQELEARIKSMGNIDFGDAPRVVRKRARRADPWFMYQNQVNAYNVRGDKIELFYNYGYIP